MLALRRTQYYISLFPDYLYRHTLQRLEVAVGLVGDRTDDQESLNKLLQLRKEFELLTL